MSIQNSLWTEKYRPKTLSEYVFSDPLQKSQINGWVKNQDLPNILAHGSAGVGKTSLAYVLLNELDIDPYDILFINASRQNSVDDMRNQITSFVSTTPFGKLKVVILDEADFLSPASQGILRGVMEQFSATSRFFLTCNYPNKIIPAIHSRTQSIQINKLDVNEFTAKMAEILLKENVEFDLDTLDSYVRGTWPDLRKCINNCQQNSIDGKLVQPVSNSSSSKDYKIEAINLFKSGKVREARKIIANQIRVEDLDDFFSFCYNNLDLWGTTDDQKDQAVLIIRKGLVQIPLVSDAEILCSAVLIELTQIKG